MFYIDKISVKSNKINKISLGYFHTIFLRWQRTYVVLLFSRTLINVF